MFALPLTGIYGITLELHAYVIKGANMDRVIQRNLHGITSIHSDVVDELCTRSERALRNRLCLYHNKSGQSFCALGHHYDPKHPKKQVGLQ